MTSEKLDEDFLEFESKVNQLMKVLDEMCNANKSDAEKDDKEEASKITEGLTDHITEDNFIVQVKHDRTVINKSASESSTSASEASAGLSVGADMIQTMDKCTFMRQIEEDALERTKIRKQREATAQDLRTQGSLAFRRQQYDKAILMYTRAIDHIKDSPMLYTNRALAYYRTKTYKLAIMDCDFVINKIDERNLRAWLYRAASYKRLLDNDNYERSITMARKTNNKQHETINNFVEKLKSDF